MDRKAAQIPGHLPQHRIGADTLQKFGVHWSFLHFPRIVAPGGKNGGRFFRFTHGSFCRGGYQGGNLRLLSGSSCVYEFPNRLRLPGFALGGIGCSHNCLLQ